MVAKAFAAIILIPIIATMIGISVILSLQPAFPTAWTDTGKVTGVIDEFNGTWYSTYNITTRHHGNLILGSTNESIVLAGNCIKTPINLNTGDIVGVIYRPMCGYEIKKHWG